MKVLELPLDHIHPYEKNPRRNDNAVEAVRKSIEAFGFQQPLVVDKNHVIIVGHTRFKAAQELGLKTVPAVVVDMPEKQAAAYRLADNKTNQASVWDNKLLLEELDFIGDDFFTGFDISDTFDVLDEDENSVIDENTAGVEYEVVFKSADRERIERMIDLWGELDV